MKVLKIKDPRFYEIANREGIVVCSYDVNGETVNAVAIDYKNKIDSLKDTKDLVEEVEILTDEEVLKEIIKEYRLKLKNKS